MAEDYLSDVCDGKTGSELFRELLRIYCEAQVEDYYKMGQWQNKSMRTDYVLIEAHRREAGAPPPPPLTSIPEPKLPEQKLLTLQGLTNRAGHNGMAKALVQLMPSNSQGTGPAAELRNCAIFISKNKLDPSRAKGMLMGLSVENRRLVMEGFKSEKIGMEATDELEEYIKKAAKSGSEAATADKAVPKPGSGADTADKAVPKSGSEAATADKAVPPGRVTNGVASGSLSPEELKQTAMFIARNKLDPTRAKTALKELTADERKMVIDGFSSNATGIEATEELEIYISGCQVTGFEDREPPNKRIKLGS